MAVVRLLCRAGHARWLGALLCLAVSAHAFAADVEVVGVGEAAYTGPAPDVAAREAALHSAKVDAVESYVVRLSWRLHPLPVPYRDYFDLSFHPELQKTMDRYLTDVAIVAERIDDAKKSVWITVRATLNEYRFNDVVGLPRMPPERK